MHKRRLQITLALAVIAGTSLSISTSSASAIPDCFKIRTFPAKPIQSDVKSAITKYFQSKNQLPISIAKNQEQIIDVNLWSAGAHQCSLGGGSFGKYNGTIPKGATAAVQVNVTHKPGVGAPNGASLLVLAKFSGKGWSVISIS